MASQAEAGRAIQKFAADAFARSPFEIFVFADGDPGQTRLRQNVLQDVEPQLVEPDTMGEHRFELYWTINGAYASDDDTNAAEGYLQRISTMAAIDVLAAERDPREISAFSVHNDCRQINWLREDLESVPDDMDEISLDNVPPLARSLAIVVALATNEYTSWLEPKIDCVNRQMGDKSARNIAKWATINERLADVGLR